MIWESVWFIIYTHIRRAVQVKYLGDDFKVKSVPNFAAQYQQLHFDDMVARRRDQDRFHSVSIEGLGLGHAKMLQSKPGCLIQPLICTAFQPKYKSNGYNIPGHIQVLEQNH